MRSYEENARSPEYSSGVYIFSDLERLTMRGLEDAAEYRMALERAGIKILPLNHPTTSKRRYELLRTLYTKGLNSFDVYRLTECRKPERYPVFIRHEHDHDGPWSGILQTRESLEESIAELVFQGRCREDRIVEEYCETVDKDGWRRKYAAFYINGLVIPRHVMFSKEVFVKGTYANEWTNSMLEEEMNYMEKNPHADQVADIFRIARVDYGRIDYGLLEGRVQTWEINTNPSISNFQNIMSKRRDIVHSRFADLYNKAMSELSKSV